MDEWKDYKLSDFLEINPRVLLSPRKAYSFVEMKDLNENQRIVLPSQTKGLKGGARFHKM